MSAVHFPDWPSVLATDPNLNEREQTSYEITIRWFLGFCKRAHGRADFEQAKAFIEFAKEEKQANEWVVERWSRTRLRLTR